MGESFTSAFHLLPSLISVTVLFFALDLWRRAVDAGRALGGDGRPGLAGAILTVWLGLTLLATHIPAWGATIAATPGLQPLLLIAALVGAVLLGWPAACRRAFDGIPIEPLLAFFYWRAVFGALIIAAFAAGRLPAGFGIPTGAGDIAVTLLMLLLVAFRPASGAIPRTPLLAWNAAGLLDLLVGVPVLGAIVLRPWAAQHGLSGHFGLQLFVVPVFIAIHLHLFARLWRERR